MYSVEDKHRVSSIFVRFRQKMRSLKPKIKIKQERLAINIQKPFNNRNELNYYIEF